MNVSQRSWKNFIPKKKSKIMNETPQHIKFTPHHTQSTTTTKASPSRTKTRFSLSDDSKTTHSFKSKGRRKKMPIRLRSPKTDLELFHKEAMTGNLSQLRDFLQHQNELLYRTNTDSGGTALHVAARCGNWKAVELFLNPPFNANRSAENWAGHNALYCALMNASPGLENHVNMLGGLNFRNSRGRPPLMESCRLRHLDVLRTLIRLQFARNAWVRQNPLSLAVKCDGGKTALHYACESKDRDIVGLILGDRSQVLRSITSHGDVIRILVSGLETLRRDLMKRDSTDYEDVEKIKMLHTFVKVARATQTVAIEGRVVRVFDSSRRSDTIKVIAYGTPLKIAIPFLDISLDSVLVPAENFPRHFLQLAMDELLVWKHANGRTSAVKRGTTNGEESSEEEEDEVVEEKMENEREKDKNKSKNDSVEEDKDMTSKDQILDDADLENQENNEDVLRKGTRVEAKSSSTSKSYFREYFTYTIHNNISHTIRTTGTIVSMHSNGTYSVEFDVDVLGIISQIKRSDIRVLEEQPSSSDEDLDEKVDEMNRQKVRNELESWKIVDEDVDDDKKKKKKDKDEDEDDEKRRKNEMIREREKAIFSQHIGIVKSKDSALLLGVGRSGEDRSMWIPLSLCVERTRETLRNECGLEIKDNFGWSALFYAVRSGEMRVLDMILKDLKERVLMRFGRSSNKAAVMKSSRFKANLSQILNTPDMDGVTPLLIAISCGHFNVTRTLLSLGADAKLRSPSGSTAISIACETNRLDIVNELLQWYQKNCKNSDTNRDKINALMNDKLLKTDTRPLYWAAENANENTLRLMLELGADVHASSTFRGLTALHVAAMSGNLEMIRVLMYFGANPSQTSISGENAITIALKSKSPFGNNVARWLERWNDVVPKDLAKRLLIRSKAGISDPSSIQSAIREDLKRNDHMNVWNSFVRNRLVQWTVASAIKNRYAYAKIRDTLISLSSISAETATKFVEALRRVMSAEEIFIWSCSASILSDVEFFKQTRQSLEKRMFKSYSEKTFNRLRSDVDVLVDSLKSGHNLGEIREKMVKTNLDLLDPYHIENRRVEVNSLLKWAYAAFTAHDTEKRMYFS